MIKNSGQLKSIAYIENYIPVSFSVNVRISIDENYQFEKVKANVRQALMKIFSFKTRDFGQNITSSEVIDVIQRVEGVKYTVLEYLKRENPFTKSHIPPITMKTKFNNGRSKPDQLLNIDKDYTLRSHFRLPVIKAMFKESTPEPAELLTINKNNIIITEILS